MAPSDYVILTLIGVGYAFFAIVVGMVVEKGKPSTNDGTSFWLGFFWPVTVTVWALFAAASWLSVRIAKLLGFPNG